VLARRPVRRRLRIYVSQGFSISIRVNRLWFGSQPVSFERINSRGHSLRNSNSVSNGILSSDNHVGVTVAELDLSNVAASVDAYGGRGIEVRFEHQLIQLSRSSDRCPLKTLQSCPVLVWCPLPMLLLAHSERRTEHFFPRPLTRSGGRGKKCGGAWGGVKNPRCEAAAICGGRPGLFSLANAAAAASQPMKEID